MRVAPLENDGTSDFGSVFLVTRHFEAMGQTTRRYIAAFSSHAEADARATHEAITDPPVVAEYISIEEIAVDDERYLTASPFTSWSPGLWTGDFPAS